MIVVSAILRKERPCFIVHLRFWCWRVLSRRSNNCGSALEKMAARIRTFCCGEVNPECTHFFNILVEFYYRTLILRSQMRLSREIKGTVYDVYMKQLDGHFAPQVNSAHERHLFRDLDFPTKLTDFTKMM